jgi:hypothetical protein
MVLQYLKSVRAAPAPDLSLVYSPRQRAQGALLTRTGQQTIRKQ